MRGFYRVMVFRSLIIVLACTLMGVSSSASDRAYESLHAKRGGSEIDKVEIERRIHALMQHPQMVGLAVAIVENGELTYAKGFGETEAGRGQDVSADTVFRWASVSKGVAAATVVSLAEDGLIDLDGQAQSLAPSMDLPQTDSGYDVSVEDVLSHRIGIVRNAYDNRIEDGQRPKIIRAALKDLPVLCEPGTCHTYQNVAYDSLSEITETVTGLPYKAVVSERIFKPLEMTTASTTHEGLVRSKSWAKPHNRARKRYAAVKPTYYRIPAAAGVNSSITDLGKWMQAQMGAGDHPLPSAVQVMLQTPRVKTPRENKVIRRHYHALENAHYGLGWRLYDYAGHRVVGHRGAVQGYRASVLFDPERQTGIALLWNSPQGRPVGLQLEMFDQVYGLPKRDWMRLNAE